ncbi:hypothetical protein CSU32_24440 [Salmonella enterica subsp. diarizonae]|nr:hypothetical protein [Salmonella enterica subsp. diarizonae]ECI3362769.1 hypothetical protein [Salmonella enterica subsp. diarizonae]
MILFIFYFNVFYLLILLRLILLVELFYFLNYNKKFYFYWVLMMPVFLFYRKQLFISNVFVGVFTDCFCKGII